VVSLFRAIKKKRGREHLTTHDPTTQTGGI
jgi:hypothetical protein